MTSIQNFLKEMLPSLFAQWPLDKPKLKKEDLSFFKNEKEVETQFFLIFRQGLFSTNY